MGHIDFRVIFSSITVQPQLLYVVIFVKIFGTIIHSSLHEITKYIAHLAHLCVCDLCGAG